MVDSQIEKLEKITCTTLIVGIDIAKEVHWAQFIDYRGVAYKECLKFNNNMPSIESIIQKMEEIKLKNKQDNIIIGMEPTGHYWKALATFLELRGYTVVLVNPHHTKKSKELDDNSQTKNDKKDALTIAKLVKDGRFNIMYLPKDEYAELRSLTVARMEVINLISSCKNMIYAVMDVVFPEFASVFATFLTSLAALSILKNAPFPSDILKLGVKGCLSTSKESAKRTMGIKKAEKLYEAAKNSIGLKSGLVGERIRLQSLLEQLELYNKQLEVIEKNMEEQLQKTGYKDLLLSIPGIGIVVAASFLGEIGDPKRFRNSQQIVRLAGFNLVENSSGMYKSKTTISKRGRPLLRSILYKIAFVMVVRNKECKKVYDYLKKRKENPLKGKQALIVIAEKAIRIMFSLMKYGTKYDPEKALGEIRKQQLAA